MLSATVAPESYFCFPPRNLVGAYLVPWRRLMHQVAALTLELAIMIALSYPSSVQRLGRLRLVRTPEKDQSAELRVHAAVTTKT